MTQLLLFLHIGSAVLLVGEILFASLWLRSSLARAADPGVTRYVITTMAVTSRGVAMPAFVVNLASGVLLSIFGHVHWSHAIWLILSIVLYTIMASLWHGTLIPLRKRMAEKLEAVGSGPLPADYEPMARQWVRISGAVLMLFAAILVLMVWKPTI
jgi:uncharacterized membrane protein